MTEDNEEKRLLKSDCEVPESLCLYECSMKVKKDEGARNKLMVACVLCVMFIISEIVGGIVANSLAILTDSAHLFCDGTSFVISLAAMKLSDKSTSKIMTFGWQRAEVLGALFSVLLIWIVTGVLVYMAILRLINNNYHIEAGVMFIMAGVGVVLNIIMGLVLHPHIHQESTTHSHCSLQHYDEEKASALSEDVGDFHSTSTDSNNTKTTYLERLCAMSNSINLRAAFIHIIGDLVQSLGVLIASAIIYFKPQWKIVDPICTFFFSALVMFTTLSIFSDVICVLMERKPSHLNYDIIKTDLSTITGVSKIHNLKLWSLTLEKSSVTCHVILENNGNTQYILREAHKILRQKHRVSEIVIQTETPYEDL